MAEHPLPPTDGNGPVEELQLDFENGSVADPILTAKVAELVEAGDHAGALALARNAMTFTEKLGMGMATGHACCAIVLGEQAALDYLTKAFPDTAADQARLIISGLTTLILGAIDAMSPDEQTAFIHGLTKVAGLTLDSVAVYEKASRA